MISYKLAKQLKEAGFPTIDLTDHEDCIYQQVEFIDGVFYHIPTLSELIETCGDEFGELARNGCFSKYTPHNDKWVAWATNKDINCGGKDPEEAVAKLWLKLNVST